MKIDFEGGVRLMCLNLLGGLFMFFLFDPEVSTKAVRLFFFWFKIILSNKHTGSSKKKFELNRKFLHGQGFKTPNENLRHR